MKLYNNHWQIAFRSNKEDKFKVINNPQWGWCADPFIVEYRNEIYIFAEVFFYSSKRNGAIAYCKYDGECFTEWIVTMEKHWHLSYPNVFVKDNDLYMCPESYQNDTVSLYKLEAFPNKWKRIEILLDNTKSVDSTFLKYEGENYLFTFEPAFHNSEGILVQYRQDKKSTKWIQKKCITDNKCCARPAGNFIYEDNQIYRVGQISESEYGEGIAVLKVESVWPDYKETLLYEIRPKELKINCSKKIVGVHTYNKYREFEVIDFKYRSYNLKEKIARKRVRKVFLNIYK